MFFRKIVLFAGLFCAASAVAQTSSVRFCVADSISREPVVGAVAALRTLADSLATPLYTTTDVKGCGLFPRVPRGKYRLTLSSLGYAEKRVDLQVSGTTVRRDTLWLLPQAKAIDKVVVEVPALRSSVEGDTLSYRASAYKVAFGSDTEALLMKMPGIDVNENGIVAQERTIQKVYVDGREFFGKDVMSAIRNIPADMIDRVDIYNTQSDQSEFTGVDNGEGFMAMNIITLPDKRRGAFGRIYGAYGLPDKYIAGGNVNLFNEARRISVIGLANNISRQNFSFEDFLGANDDSSRGQNKDFAVRPLSGISTVQAVGVNYSDEWKKAKITASYFFNRTDNHNTSISERQTYTSTDKLVLYDDKNRSTTLNLNHRFNSRIDYKFSPSHSIMMRTSFSSQNNDNGNELKSRTENKFSDGNLQFVNRRRNFGSSDGNGINFSNSLLYNYRFHSRVAQSLTVGVGGALNTYKQTSLPRLYTFRNIDDEACDTTAYSSRSISFTDRDQPGYGLSGNVAYTRSLSKRSRMSIEYRLNYSENSVDRRTYLFDDATNAFQPERSQRQSTEYDYSYLTHRAGGTYQYYLKKTKIASSLYYQHTDFEGNYKFPYERTTKASFNNMTYNLVANISVNRNNTLKFDASGRTSNPRATDLQAIVNTTNRQYVVAGNPQLDPVYTHHLSGQYIRSVPAKGRTFTFSTEYETSSNTIADSLVIDSPDFIIDSDGTKLGEGNQYTKPVNISGYWNFRVNANYGIPVRWLRSNLNLRAGFSTGHIPSVINGARNELKNKVYLSGVTLGSNISEFVDFKLSYTDRYHVSKSTSHLRTVDNTYFSQQANAQFAFVVWKRLVLRASADFDSYRGITDSFLEERLICNAMAGLKVFHNKLGEVSVGINDMLDQNGTAFRRTVTGTTIRNVTDLSIGRYLYFQLTYNLRLYRSQSKAVMNALQQ